MSASRSSADRPPYRRAPVSQPARWRARCGAVLGGVVGGAAESAQNQQAAQANTVVVERQQSAQLERKAGDFKRAAGACLEARGYSVR